MVIYSVCVIKFVFSQHINIQHTCMANPSYQAHHLGGHFLTINLHTYLRPLFYSPFKFICHPKKEEILLKLSYLFIFTRLVDSKVPNCVFGFLSYSIVTKTTFQNIYQNTCVQKDRFNFFLHLLHIIKHIYRFKLVSEMSQFVDLRHQLN